MKKKGFTLVELLGVIVILAILLVIAVPSVINVINKSKKGVFESSIKMAFKAAEYERLIDPKKSAGNLTDLETFDSKKLVGTWKFEDDKIKLCNVSNGEYLVRDCIDENSKYLIEGDNNPTIMLVVDNFSMNQLSELVIEESDFKLYNDQGKKVIVKVDGNVVSLPHTINADVYGEKDIVVEYSLEGGNFVKRSVDIFHEFIYADTSGANSPDLADNMLPVKWNGTSWVKADSTNEVGDNEWYDYDDKVWANSVTVTSSSRENYVNSLPGTPVDMNDIVQMYVWIPRYKYNMSSDSYNTNNVAKFNIEFETDKEITGVNDLTTPCINDVYCTHPAFINFEVRGIWVGKFEAGNTSGDIKIKPNIETIRGLSPSVFFDISRDINASNNNSGFNTDDEIVDPHMITNTEWGAVAYLATSDYGSNKELWNNPKFLSGQYGINKYDKWDTVTTLYTYETEIGVKGSTTGNIYGVYDMAGGNTEFVSAILPVASNSNNQSLIANINTKYVDNFSKGDVLESTKGGAFFETPNWRNHFYYFPTNTNPFFARGIDWRYPENNGLFSSTYMNGAFSSFGFRVTVTL